MIFFFFKQYKIQRVACDSPESLQENLKYLAYQVVNATTPDDWFSEQIITSLTNSAANKPQELQKSMDDLMAAVDDYDDMSENVIDDATKILVQIYDQSRFNVDTLDFVSTHLDSFKDEKTLLIGCAVVYKVEDELTNFFKPIHDSITEFNNAMSDSELKTIIKDIEDISNNYNGADANIAEAEVEIRKLIDLLRSGIKDSPTRFANSKHILENSVAEFLKPFINPNNPTQSCAEEYYLRTSLYASFADLVAPNVH